MGNLLNRIRVKKIQTEDNTRLLLISDLEEKINNFNDSMMQKYTNIVNTYNKEINDLKMDMNKLKENYNNINTKCNSLNVLIEEKDTKIKRLEDILQNFDSSDEFLSTINT
tara:strand:+ start:80 stop:412 length:333 start_codon:yes stop_codon:yes gene_type:complete